MIKFHFSKFLCSLWVSSDLSLCKNVVLTTALHKLSVYLCAWRLPSRMSLLEENPYRGVAALPCFLG